MKNRRMKLLYCKGHSVLLVLCVSGTRLLARQEKTREDKLLNYNKRCLYSERKGLAALLAEKASFHCEVNPEMMLFGLVWFLLWIIVCVYYYQNDEVLYVIIASILECLGQI